VGNILLAAFHMDHKEMDKRLVVALHMLLVEVDNNIADSNLK